MYESFITIIRLLLSAVLGGVIGFEREAHNRPAGFRTHILVTLGSTLIMMVSKNMGPGADSARIAAQVVSGIGFLGAGTIIRTGTNIEGLTTAASLWVCSAIGLAIGNGFYLGGIFITFIVLFFLGKVTILDRFLKNRNHKTVVIIAEVTPGLIGKVATIFGDNNINIVNISLEALDVEDDPSERISFELKTPKDINLKEIIRDIYGIKGIDSIDLESLE